MAKPNIEIHYAGDWAGLYVDAEIYRDEHGIPVVGDSYRVEEHAFELVGVMIVRDDAFMRGQDSRDGVARTLDEVDAYRWERDGKREQAEALRRQAAEMLERAKGLDGSVKP